MYGIEYDIQYDIECYIHIYINTVHIHCCSAFIPDLAMIHVCVYIYTYIYVYTQININNTLSKCGKVIPFKLNLQF